MDPWSSLTQVNVGWVFVKFMYMSMHMKTWWLQLKYIYRPIDIYTLASSYEWVRYSSQLSEAEWRIDASVN